MSDGVLDGTADPLQGTELSTRALRRRVENWLGHGTRPSRLYPHQWSWDSACIAMGYAGWNQPRAEMELRSLFAGQWANGLLPHIVFAEGDGRYFPGPDFWQVERSPDAPSDVRTSGIAQPPLHATAALRMFRRVPDRDRGIAFLRELAPKLHAWHAYLYRERTRGGGGLVEIWHPWESGMDNSPLWDEALARIHLTPAQVPSRTGAWTSSSRTPRSDRPMRSTTATSTSLGSSASSSIAATGSRTRRRSPYSPWNSTRCWCRRTSIWPRSRRYWARIPASTRSGRN